MTLVTEMCQQNNQALQIFRKVGFFFECILLSEHFIIVLVSAKSRPYSEEFNHVRL